MKNQRKMRQRFASDMRKDSIIAEQLQLDLH